MWPMALIHSLIISNRSILVDLETIPGTRHEVEMQPGWDASLLQPMTCRVYDIFIQRKCRVTQWFSG